MGSRPSGEMYWNHHKAREDRRRCLLAGAASKKFFPRSLYGYGLIKCATRSMRFEVSRPEPQRGPENCALLASYLATSQELVEKSSRIQNANFFNRRRKIQRVWERAQLFGCASDKPEIRVFPMGGCRPPVPGEIYQRRELSARAAFFCGWWEYKLEN